MMKTGINWDVVRTQLRASERDLEEALQGNPELTQAVFRKRAAQLAGTKRSATSQTPPIQALVFALHSESYAIRLDELREVLPFRSCTPVPGAAPDFLGVISRRGELRPVLDLGRIIHPQTESQTPSSLPGFILMLRKPGQQFGLRVDRVEGVRELSAGQPDPAWTGHFTTRIPGESLLLLDLDRLLAAHR